MERKFDVYWQGPFNEEKLVNDETLVLYSVYGTHPLYGNRSLVYIGMTTQPLTTRMNQHKRWMSLESDPVEIYAASIGEFTTWKAADETDVYDPPLTEDILAIESLLILAHQPAYNSKSKQSAELGKNYRIFNTGRFGALLPEVSGLYYLGD